MDDFVSVRGRRKIGHAVVDSPSAALVESERHIACAPLGRHSQRLDQGTASERDLVRRPFDEVPREDGLGKHRQARVAGERIADHGDVGLHGSLPGLDLAQRHPKVLAVAH